MQLRTLLIFSLPLAFPLAFRTPANAQGEVLFAEAVQFSTAIPNQPTPDLPPSITNEIARDWSNSKMEPRALTAGKPDHSLSTVWVRIFPLPSTPLGDPYPQTVDVNVIDFESTSPMSIYDLDTLQLLGTSKTLHLDFSQAKFKIGAKSAALTKLSIVPTTATTTVRWDQGKVGPDGKPTDVGVKLRGAFVVKQTMFEYDGNGKPMIAPRKYWSVINTVPIDAYIESVVPSEIISSWSTETLKAQAIAARTYGIFEVADSRTRGVDWDMDPTTWYQSYRGTAFWDPSAKVWRKVELASTTAAVTSTDGQVITYQGQVIKAYFSANSGGITCLVSECFELPDLPYIQQIPDAPGVESMPGGTWGSKATLSPTAIYNQLVAYGVHPTQPVDHLEALRIGPSGRVWTLRVHLTSGDSIDLDEDTTRKIMHLYGPIRSFLYQLGAMKNGTQEIIGHGYGHGVGLSQWGAQTFAKQGWDAHKILLYYYKNVAVTKLN